MSQFDDTFEDLNSYLYNRLKQEIWNQVYQHGTKLRQEHLAKEYGVSRTPILRVLERLTAENILEYVPRRGFFVKRLSLDEMLNIFALREVLDGAAAKACALHASDEDIEEIRQFFAKFQGKWSSDLEQEYVIVDQQFHSRLTKLSGNKLLQEINDSFSINQFSYQKGLMRPPIETLAEHQSIIHAIVERDPLKAQLLAMEHIQKSMENIRLRFDEHKFPNR